MAEITSFIYCKSMIKENNDIILTGPIANIQIPAFPGLFSYCFSFGIFEGDSTKDAVVKCVLVDLQGNRVHESEYTVRANPTNTPNVDGDLNQGIQLNLDYKNVRFDAPGIYHTEIFLGDEMLVSCPVRVTTA